jgi:uncharacterized protein YlxW (UPF0749 family)
MLNNWNFLVAEIWGFLAIAAVLTFVVCWYVWGRSAVRANVTRLKQTEQDLEIARSSLTQSRAEVQRAERKQEELKDRLLRENAKFAQYKKQVAAQPNTMERASENMKNFFDERRNGDAPDAVILDTLSRGSQKAKETFQSLFARLKK